MAIFMGNSLPPVRQLRYGNTERRATVDLVTVTLVAVRAGGACSSSADAVRLSKINRACRCMLDLGRRLPR